MRIFTFFTVILLVSLAGCTKDENMVQNSTKSSTSIGLVGTWSWLRSSGSIAEVTVTPESTGNTMIIEFTAEGVLDNFVDGRKVYFPLSGSGRR